MPRFANVIGTDCQRDCAGSRTCAGCHSGLNRRGFLAATAAWGAASLLMPRRARAAAADSLPPLPPYPKVKVYVF